MGIEDELKRRAERQAREAADAQQGAARAQAARLAFAKRVENDIINAIKTDPGLGEPQVVPVTGVIGESSPVQVECSGSGVRVIFVATVKATPASAYLDGPIRVVVGRKGNEGTYSPTLVGQPGDHGPVQEQWYSLAATLLLQTVNRLVHTL
jgi:hypothetical protein